MPQIANWQDHPHWSQDRDSFNQVAENYDRYRPGYPDEAVNFVISTSQIPEGGRILEVGCGTGKATRLFAGRGYSILGVEPGENLAEIARRSLAGNPQVSFEISTFEGWADRGRRYDLVLSAQAWHWVRREVGYAKAAQILSSGGSLALIWNMYPDPHGPVWDAMQRIYDQYFPPDRQKELPYQELADLRATEIVESGYFHPPDVGAYPWVDSSSTEEYLGLLSTYSDHIALSPETRAALFAEIGNLIDGFGGAIVKPYVTYVYVARKKES